jgi:DNA-binding NarL/FixJ family response regulator
MMAQNGQLVTHLAIQSTCRLMRDALAAHLSHQPDFEVVGRVSAPDELLSLCDLRRPDVVLLDAGRDADATAEAIATVVALHGRFPSVQVVLTYEQLSATQLRAASEAGVSLMAPSSHGLTALVAVLPRRSAPAPGPLYDGVTLTRRELEIILLMGSGHSVPEIAVQLGISHSTIENHKRRIYAKLDAHSGVHAVARAVTLGILERHARTEPDRTRPPGEAGRATVVVVAGRPGLALDRVFNTLTSSAIPFIWERSPTSAGPDVPADWAQYPGPMAAVLVDPGPDAWRTPTELGLPVILVHSTPLDRPAVIDVLRRGADGMLPADRVSDQLILALVLVTSGYLVLDSAQVRPLLDAIDARPGGLPELSARECDILRSIAHGDSVRQTARGLGIATKTVENTQARLFRKLGVRNRAGALAAADALGLLQPADGRQPT